MRLFRGLLLAAIAILGIWSPFAELWFAPFLENYGPRVHPTARSIQDLGRALRPPLAGVDEVGIFVAESSGPVINGQGLKHMAAMAQFYLAPILVRYDRVDLDLPAQIAIMDTIRLPEWFGHEGLTIVDHPTRGIVVLRRRQP